jgi:glycosyltransferase involved in cell wall biosynthesis
MRIAIIATLLPSDSRGGAEAYVEAAARSLAERHEVRVFAGSSGTLDGVPTVRLPRLPELDQTVHPLAYRLLWHARDQWLPSVHFAVVRELKRWRPDIVVTHHPQGLSAAVFTAIAQLGLPHVHMAHDLNILCARTSMTRGGEYCGGRCATCLIQRRVRGSALKLNVAKVVCVSQYVCERHVETGVVPREVTEVIKLGAQPGRARVRRLEGAEPRLGFIGTLGRHKGILTLLEAFRRVPDRWRLLIAGSGPAEPDVEQASRADDRISYLGHVEGARKDEFFDTLDLVVIPSEWEEPATFVVVEAAVRGIPAVVSDRGGLPEAPEARVFRARDPDDLLAGVRWFADDPARLEETSRRLLDRQDDFSWSTHVAKVEQLLLRTLEEAYESRPSTRAAT